MNRLTLSIAGLFTLAASFYIYVWLTPEPAPSMLGDADTLVPDYVTTDITTYVYDARGKLAHEVYAAQADYFTRMDLVLFQRPSYQLYTEEGNTWLMQAHAGRLMGNDVIELIDDVIVSSSSKDEFIQRITTEFLALDLTERLALSDKLVVIEGEDYIIQGIGVRADLDHRQFELKEHVQTRYYPSH